MYFFIDLVVVFIMKIYMFNKDWDWVKLGVDIIVKYLDNIYLYFEEEKYWKIKL